MQWRLFLTWFSAAAALLPAAALDPPAPAEILLDQARSAPIEIFADVTFRLIRAKVLTPQRQTEVLEEIFQRAGEARQALPLRGARSDQPNTGRAEFVARSYDLHLDALSLRARAVESLAAHDPRLARRLFEEIPVREWAATGCDATLTPDPRLYFTALSAVIRKEAFTAKEWEKREPLQLAERTLRSITILEELVAAVPFLQKVGQAAGDAQRISTAYGSAAALVKEAMAQKPKCTEPKKSAEWSNEASFSELLQEIGELKVEDRDTPEWAYRALQLMRKVEDWREASGVPMVDMFHQRVKLWQALEDRCPPGDLHRKALEGFLSALNEPAVIRDAPAEWLVHIGYPLVRSSLVSEEMRNGGAKAGSEVDEAQTKLPEQLMQASPNLVVAIYGQLAAMRIRVEWLTPAE